MRSNIWWTIIILLFIIIGVLTWLLVTTPAPTNNGTVATSTTGADTAPLRERVAVHAPISGAQVPKTFAVTGEAPGNWYFEASFPIQVRDMEHNKVGQAVAQAQSDWMTTGQVPFKAEVTVAGYSGPAILVLLRDNPSGLPENDDALEVPIIVQ